MKQFLILILAILYFGAATGATVHVHYCMGRLVGVSLLGDDAHHCGRCGMKKGKNNGCCKDEQRIVKCNEQHVQSALHFTCTAQSVMLPAAPAFYNAEEGLAANTRFAIPNNNDPPPGWYRLPIYILVQDFRI